MKELKLSGLRKKLDKSKKVISELIRVVHNGGNDLIDRDHNEKRGRFVVYAPPKFEEIISKNASIVPMPIIFAYLPSVYFRIFARIIMGTLNPETMQFDGNFTFSAEELLDSLSVADKSRFKEVVRFLIQYKFLYFTIHEKDGIKRMNLSIADPYRNHYCGVTVTAMSVVAKTHMANNGEFLDEPKQKWREWKKIKPIVVDFDSLEK